MAYIEKTIGGKMAVEKKESAVKKESGQLNREELKEVKGGIPYVKPNLVEFVIGEGTSCSVGKHCDSGHNGGESCTTGLVCSTGTHGDIEEPV